MPDDPEDIRRWRRKAEELRTWAASTHDETAQMTYRSLARKWDQRADHLEELREDRSRQRNAPPDLGTV